ncbi:MAG: DNA recombination protein RmuC, partial [Bifidobacteriaceae bacterium]|nr:DNA recombination protein RmuC [Bifidobacteriaceae bacterium]
MELLFSISSVALLIVVIVLLLRKQGQSDLGQISELIKQSNQEQRDAVQKQINEGATEQFRRFEMISKSVQQTLDTNRSETNKTLAESRSETVNTLDISRKETNQVLESFRDRLEQQLSVMQRANSENTDLVNRKIEERLKVLQESNEKRLEQMQGVVDEKLQKTLDSRLTESFKQVGAQLESVQRGVGEMKTLAASAESLKNALVNVRARGAFGEVILEKLLADTLAPNQYERNVRIGDKIVEFAIKLPGKDDASPLYLPIDSKFPVEAYNRLFEADIKSEIDNARADLAKNVEARAKEISTK